MRKPLESARRQFYARDSKGTQVAPSDARFWPAVVVVVCYNCSFLRAWQRHGSCKQVLASSGYRTVPVTLDGNIKMGPLGMGHLSL